MDEVEQPTGALRYEDLLPWVEDVGRGKVVRARLASGGNRCVGWSVDVRQDDGRILPLFLRYQAFQDGSGGPYTVGREAEIYAALGGSAVQIPRLVARHPHHQAMLTERAAGDAAYRALTDGQVKDHLARQAVRALLQLHRVDASKLDMPRFGGHRTIHAAARAEMEIWYDMYRATGRDDPLIEFGRLWLEDNLPVFDGPAVLVHGDAGPGNFMFDDGELTRLIDWELSHLGDPMEDLAWFSLRSVLEPVPDFPACVREYESASGEPVDLDRVRYHRAFVSWRICIIRHCNASGQAGASVISRALNRRLLMEAIDAAEGRGSTSVPPVDTPPREYDRMFAQVLDDIRAVILPGCTDKAAILKAKDAAKAIKFMRQLYNVGDEIERREIAALAELLGEAPQSIDAGRSALAASIRARSVDVGRALDFLRMSAAFETQLASHTMGALATRHFPPLTD